MPRRASKRLARQAANHAHAQYYANMKKKKNTNLVIALFPLMRKTSSGSCLRPTLTSAQAF
jgi:hypothetical protein